MNHLLAATTTKSNAGSTALGFILLAFGFVAYWVPSMIAIARHKDIPNFAGVIIINFLLGWTFIGWIVALVMAVRSRPQQVMYAPGPYGYAPPQPGPYGPSQQGPYGLTPPPQQAQTFPYPPAQQPQQWQDPQQPQQWQDPQQPQQWQDPRQPQQWQDPRQPQQWQDPRQP